MHLSCEHDVDKFMDGTRGMFLERIVGESELRRDGGVFFLDTAAERLPEAVFNFGRALTRVRDLAMLSRTGVGSTFYDDLADLLARPVDESKIQPDYRPDAPNAEAYRVDYRIESKDDIPLFLYGAPNRDKARLTTIMLSYFHRCALPFTSILVFGNREEIPRLDLTGLSNVGGEMVASLEAGDDLDRKLRMRMAA